VRRWVAIVFALVVGGSGCLVPSPESPVPCYAEVRGTLWPPSGEPMFEVSGRRIVLARAGEVVAETDTDQRGRFALRAYNDGRYELAFDATGHRAAAELTLKVCAPTRKVDLIARPR